MHTHLGPSSIKDHMKNDSYEQNGFLLLKRSNCDQIKMKLPS